jgi:hypothetical protein
MCRKDVSEWCPTVGIKGRKRSRPVSSQAEFNELLAAHVALMKQMHRATKQMHEQICSQQQQIQREKQRWGKLRAHLDAVVHQAGAIDGKKNRLQLRSLAAQIGTSERKQADSAVPTAMGEGAGRVLNREIAVPSKRRLSLIGGMQQAPTISSGATPLYSAQKFAERRPSHIAQRIAAARRAIGFPEAGTRPQAHMQQQQQLRSTEALITAHQAQRRDSAISA